MKLGLRLALSAKPSGDALGPELFVDGSFDDPSKHSSVTETSVTGGKLVGTATTASRAVAQVPNLLAVTGERYRVVFTITNYTAGNFRLNFGGVNGTLRSAVGTYSQDMTAISNGAASMIFLSGTTASVDNVSIRKIL
jgi:hypothetical protein